MGHLTGSRAFSCSWQCTSRRAAFTPPLSACRDKHGGMLRAACCRSVLMHQTDERVLQWWPELADVGGVGWVQGDRVEVEAQVVVAMINTACMGAVSCLPPWRHLGQAVGQHCPGACFRCLPCCCN